MKLLLIGILFVLLLLPLAGHCILSFPETGIATVVAGLHNLNDFIGIEQIRHITRTNMWVHEDFAGTVGPHDIGLIRFQTPFTFGVYVNAIALPDPDQIHTGVGTLHGWGSISAGFYPEYPNILQTAEMPIIPLATCRSSWDDSSIVHDNHVCAGALAGGPGACSGDNGGALVQNGVAVGVFQFTTFPCGAPNRPAVYTRVSAYVDWIQRIMYIH